ncbi:MAG: hypothetical protein FWD35_03635 [Oscillospiraceae bacterium]|nr:hypothetical protein [Oscillospiraceae bacterium]
MTENIVKQNKAMSYFWFRLREMRVILILNILIGVMSYPLLAIMVSRYSHYTPDSTMLMLDVGMIIFVTPFIAFATLLMAYIGALMSFGFMHNANIRDMHLALPLTHRQRFWASFLSGASVTFVPYIGASLLGLGIFRIFFNEKLLEDMLNPQDIMGILDGTAAALTVGALISDYILPVMFMGFMVMLFIFALTTLCNMVCGKFLTAGFFPFLYSAAVPLLIATLSTLALYNAWGMTAVGGYPYFISSPLGMLFASITLIEEHVVFAITQPVYLVPVLAVIGAMIAGAFFLSKNVKAENIGKHFLFKNIYNVYQAFVCLSIISLGSLLFTLLSDGVPQGFVSFFPVFPVFVSLVAYFIGHVIHHKGLGKLKSGAIKYAVTVSASIALCVILVAGQGFGVPNRVPAARDVQSVRITNTNSRGGANLVLEPGSAFESVQFRRQFLHEGSYTSEGWAEIINEARGIHRSFIDNPCPESGTVNDNIYSRPYSISIEYVLKNGLTVTRNYSYSSKGVEMLIERGILAAAQQQPPSNPWSDPWGDIWDDPSDLDDFFGDMTTDEWEDFLNMFGGMM